MSDAKVPKREKASFRLRHAQKGRRLGPLQTSLSFQWEQKARQKQIERDYITYHSFSILITLQNKTMKAHKIIVKSLSKLNHKQAPSFLQDAKWKWSHFILFSTSPKSTKAKEIPNIGKKRLGKSGKTAQQIWKIWRRTGN